MIMTEKQKELQEKILKSKNSKLCLKFAENIKGADLDKLEKIIIRYGNLDNINRIKKLNKKLTINEFAKKVNRSIATIRRWINSGKIKTTWEKREVIQYHNVVVIHNQELKKICLEKN